jgi:hypothetical protein
MLTQATQADNHPVMDLHPFDAGKAEMAEIIASAIYERYYLFQRKWHGKDHDTTRLLYNILSDIRDIQATDLIQKSNEPTQDE